jgi:hypothetical protein
LVAAEASKLPGDVTDDKRDVAAPSTRRSRKNGDAAEAWSGFNDARSPR